MANNCKHYQFAKRNCDVDNIFAPEHRQGRLMNDRRRSDFCAVFTYKDNGEIPQRDGGSSASDKHRRRHSGHNLGSLNLIIRKDSQHAACAAVIGGDGHNAAMLGYQFRQINIVQRHQIAVPVSILLAGSNKKLRLGVPISPAAEHIFPAVCCTTCINPSASERLTAYG